MTHFEVKYGLSRDGNPGVCGAIHLTPLSGACF